MSDRLNPDPRVTLARPDLAELALEGVLEAGAYRPVTPMQAVAPAVAVRAAPDPAATLLDQVLFGELFDVLEICGGFAWGRARRDGVVGYAAVSDLNDEILEPTHRVSAVAAPVLDDPGAPPVGHLGLNALVTVHEISGGFARTARQGWMALSDLADFLAFDAEPAAVAERFVGSPYQAGGRDGAGLDAPALVQQALYACGRACPRATDQQLTLGQPCDADRLMRGDLVFWPDHVAMMLDDSRLIHADAGRGVAIETLDAAADRLRAPLQCRRLGAWAL